MIFAFTVIALLTIAVVFLIFKLQTLGKELALTRQSAKASSKKINYAFYNLVLMSKELQNALNEQVELSNRKGIFSASDYPVISAIAHNFSQIVMDCCEKGDTVEEALRKVCSANEIDFEQIKEIAKKQPSDVRMAWSKNTVDGFVVAINRIARGVTAKEKSAES